MLSPDCLDYAYGIVSTFIREDALERGVEVRPGRKSRQGRLIKAARRPQATRSERRAGEEGLRSRECSCG